ncbi:aspartyl-phosphate phosphatase Spo0E family protein [Oceanobacillus massiliensis]|uniref:aspartyl-phosphate phosphatase Spo0E family protein n=1 Tax=Oceanobacillus massiliensis TaxID=1465765 RepID=UPI000303DABA|nr:aspartyl-phosphate phosphatase Spo0E family protein [Oceanobacillus massiliensis]
MNTKEKIETQVELLRAKMYNASESKLQNQQIIKISQELDVLLNKLEQIEENNYS